MVGTATLLAAGFIGAEAGDLFAGGGGGDLFGGGGGADSLIGAGGGTDALTGGGNFTSSDPQAMQAFNDMAQQGQMNAMSLIDNTQYELVPAGSSGSGGLI
jgi:hypothetical protein